MPGVTVTTATRSGPSNPLVAQSSRYFVAGLTERGPVDRAVELRSMADYRRAFGDRVAYGALFDDLTAFFAEGGSSAYVARVVAATGTTVGNLTLNDRAAVPAATLRIDALSPGAWSSRVTVEVLDGTTANTYRIRVAYDGTVVEDYNNLASPAAAVSALSTSNYVRAVDLGSATAAPANNPAVLAATALTAGNDNRAAIVAGDYITALDRFDRGLGDGAVAIPGQPIGTVGAGLNTHARANHRLALLAAARGTTTGGLITAAATINSEHAGLFAPWVLVPDEAGGARAISPEGYVAAMRARAHDEAGPFRAAAGGIAVARHVIGVDQAFTRAEGDQLDTARVSAIRLIQNTVRLYGWRSLSQDESNYALLTGRDTLNRLVVEGERRLEDYVFQTIDGKGQLLSRINGELVGMVEPLANAGGLFARFTGTGELIDPGYRVDTGPDVNPLDQLARNILNARLAVRVSPSGALINLTIVKVGVTAAV